MDDLTKLAERVEALRARPSDRGSEALYSMVYALRDCVAELTRALAEAQKDKP
jgi:hypothetical protein